jgi:hypothetical protein
MRPSVLRKAAESLRQSGALTSYEIFYHGEPHLWLNHPERNGKVVQLAMRIASGLMRRLPGALLKKNFIMAPHLVILAKK